MAGWRPTPGTGKWWVLGIVFGLAFTAWATWQEYSVSDQKISVRDIGYTVVDDRTVTLNFEVTKPADGTVVCTVQAQDLHKNVVGSTTVPIPPAATRTNTYTATIRTTTLAFAALTHDCVRG
jgi:hypothetical protein